MPFREPILPHPWFHAPGFTRSRSCKRRIAAAKTRAAGACCWRRCWAAAPRPRRCRRSSSPPAGARPAAKEAATVLAPGGAFWVQRQTAPVFCGLPFFSEPALAHRVGFGAREFCRGQNLWPPLPRNAEAPSGRPGIGLRASAASAS